MILIVNHLQFDTSHSCDKNCTTTCVCKLLLSTSHNLQVQQIVEEVVQQVMLLFVKVNPLYMNSTIK